MRLYAKRAAGNSETRSPAPPIDFIHLLAKTDATVHTNEATPILFQRLNTLNSFEYIIDVSLHVTVGNFSSRAYTPNDLERLTRTKVEEQRTSTSKEYQCQGHGAPFNFSSLDSDNS